LANNSLHRTLILRAGELDRYVPLSSGLGLVERGNRPRRTDSGK